MAETLTNPTVSAQLSINVAAGPLSGTVRQTYGGPTLTIGSTAGQINRKHSVDFAVTAGTPYTLDLTALTDLNGAAMSFSFWTHLLIENESTTTGQDMTVGGGTNGVFTADPVPIQANGGGRMWLNPNPGVTVDGTHKIIQITVAAGTAVAGKLTIFGR